MTRQIRHRIYLSLPWAGALAAAYGVASDQQIALWVGLVGALIGPAHGMLAAHYTRGDDTGETVGGDVPERRRG